MCASAAARALCIRVRPCNRLRQPPRLWMMVSVVFFAMSGMMRLDSTQEDNPAKRPGPSLCPKLSLKRCSQVRGRVVSSSRFHSAEAGFGGPYPRWASVFSKAQTRRPYRHENDFPVERRSRRGRDPHKVESRPATTNPASTATLADQSANVVP